jgi:ribosomal protein S18 acetylase RimI-like enzyme
LPFRAEGATVEVRALAAADRTWVRERLAVDWGGPLVVTPSGARDASLLDGFVAVRGAERVGLVTFEFDARGDCEVVTLDSYAPHNGIGTALLAAVRATAHTAGAHRCWLVTSNDNTAALRFYQKRGWDLVTVHRDAIAAWRKLKPNIAQHGIDAIPVRHALELELRLTP